MRHAICLGALSTLLLWAGCSVDHQPSTPALPDAVVTPTAPTQATCTFAPLAQPGRVYVFTGSSSASVSDWTSCSRFVLYDSGVFELQFARAGSYPGRYRVSGKVVDFTWAGSSAAGPWGSDATLDGNTLSVHYNAITAGTWHWRGHRDDPGR
jgi:hypothetical protein